MSDATLFVSGASGHLGRQTVEFLLEAGAAGRIIAGTRNPEKLADLAEKGVTVRYTNFEDKASLEEAFQGVDRLLLISIDAGDRKTLHTNAIEAAQAAGVKHVAYTSIVNPTDTPVVLAADHAHTEAALEASTLNWTILRNNIYMEVTAQSINQALKFGGTLSNAIGDGLHAYISREDCARAAAADLLSDFDGRRVLNITGSEALSQADIAKIGTEITGTPITYVPISLETVRENLSNAGFPPPVIDIIATFDAGGAERKFEGVSDDFKTLTGREPRHAADVLREILK